MPNFLSKVTSAYEVLAGLSPVLYHWTEVSKAASILAEDRFKLATNLGSSTDRKMTSKGKFYYFSTSRIPTGGYMRDVGVIFKLDGVKLQDSFKGSPFSYWEDGFEDRIKRRSADENEDRILSAKPEIRPASRYITEVHLHYDNFDKVAETIRKIAAETKKLKIPFYWYDDPKDFKLLNKKKATKLPEWVYKGAEKFPSYQRTKKRFFAPVLELYYTVDPKKLSDQAKSWLRRLENYQGASYLESEIHNRRASGDRDLLSLIKLIQKDKAKDVNEFVKNLLERHDKVRMALSFARRVGFTEGDARFRKENPDASLDEGVELWKQHLAKNPVPDGIGVESVAEAYFDGFTHAYIYFHKLKDADGDLKRVEHEKLIKHYVEKVT